MDNYTANRLNMIRLEKSVMDAYNLKWDGFTAIENYMNKINASLLIITAKEHIVMGVVGGPASDKAQKEQLMVHIALQVAGGGYAYAADTGNETLMKQMDLTKSDFSNMLDADEAAKAGMVYDVLNPIVADLADYKITPALMTELKAKTNDYIATLELPKTSIEDGKKAREEIKKQVKFCIGILELLDKLMIHFDNETDYEFYDKYMDARVIIDLGKGHKTEILILQAEKSTTIFGNKFSAGDTITVRNHGNGKAQVGFSSTEDGPIETIPGEVDARSEKYFTMPKSLLGTALKYFVVMNMSKVEAANVTVFLAHGPTHSKADGCELSGVIK